MKTFILAAIRCSLLFVLPTLTYAISAQWDLDPISGDWNTAANWTPNGIPNGPANIATFGLSNTTDVSISADIEVNSIIFTPEATNQYRITATDGFTLTISGAGITNASGTSQTFVTTGFGQISFTNSSSGSGRIVNLGITNFFDNSTAGTSSILNSFAQNINAFGITNFFDNSTAGSARIESFPGDVNFFDSSSAGGAILVTFGNAGAPFGGEGGSSISFLDSSQGGTAQIELFGFGNVLDISSHN